MEFNPGMLGVAIVVLSLISSCLFGVAINVNKESVQEDVDNYITDVTGLYATSGKEKAYVEYNPASNLNGYSVTTGQYLYREDGTRTTETIIAPSSGSTYIDYSNLPLRNNTYGFEIYKFTTTQNAKLYHTNGILSGTEFGPFLKTSATTWVWGTITIDSTSFKIIGEEGTVYNIQFKEALEIPWSGSSTTEYRYSLPADTVLRIENGSTNYVPIPSYAEMVRTQNQVTVMGATYSNPTIYLASQSDTISRESTSEYTYTYTPNGFDMLNAGTLSGTHSGADIATQIRNTEISESKECGTISVYFGTGTMTDGTNTYTSPQRFYKSNSGWVNENGNLTDMTFTPSADIMLRGYTYFVYETNSYELEFTSISVPMSLKVTRNNGTDYTQYFFVRPDNNSITITNTGSTITVNGTVVSTGSDTVKWINISLNNLASNQYCEMISHSETDIALSNPYYTTSRNGTLITEYEISYGDGIPSDEDYAIYHISTSEIAELRDTNGSLNGTNFGPFIANTDTTWTWGARTASTSVFSAVGQTDTEFTIISIGFSQITIITDFDMVIPAGNSVIKITSNGTDTYIQAVADTHIIKSGLSYEVDGIEYTSVDYIGYATYSGEEVTYYADIKDFPVRFTESPIGNNYPLSYALEQTRERTVDVTDYDNPTSIAEGKPYYALLSASTIHDPTLQVYRFQAEGPHQGSYNYVPLSTVISEELAYASTHYTSVGEIVLKIPLQIMKKRVTYTYYHGTNTPTDPDYDMTFMIYWPSNGAMIIPSADLSKLEQGNLEDPYTQNRLAYIYKSGGNPDFGSVITEITCRYNITTGIYTLYLGNYYIGDSANLNEYVLAYPTSNFKLTMYSISGTNARTQVAETTLTSNNSMTVEYVSEKSTAYLDPRYGVTMGEGIPTWSNGYQNGAMDVVIYLGAMDRDGDGIDEIGGLEVDKELMLGFDYDTLPQSRFFMHHTANGTTELGLYYYDLTDPLNGEYLEETSTIFGSGWIAYNVRFDFINGKIYAQQISAENWNGFTDWSSTQPYTEIGEFKVKTRDALDNDVWTVSKGSVNAMTYWDENTMLNKSAIQVSRTEVYLNTYGVIMIDPHVNIMNWYPDYTHFKMKFTKIASIGSSITINGTSFPIEGNELNINGTKVNISEFEVEFDKKENDTYTLTVSSLKDDTSAEIKNVTDTNIAMSGAWYFTSGYYTVTQEWVEKYSWDVGDGIVYGYSGIVLFMMGFIALIGFIWWKAKPEMFGFLDIAILIVAEVILYIILA